jgi:hypothetical protein
MSKLTDLRSEVAGLRSELERRLAAITFLTAERDEGRTPSKAARREAEDRPVGVVPASKVVAAFLAASTELKDAEEKDQAEKDEERRNRLRIENALRFEASRQRPVCEPGRPPRLDGPSVGKAGDKVSEKASGLAELLGKGEKAAAK